MFRNPIVIYLLFVGTVINAQSSDTFFYVDVEFEKNVEKDFIPMGKLGGKAYYPNKFKDHFRIILEVKKSDGTKINIPAQLEPKYSKSEKLEQTLRVRISKDSVITEEFELNKSGLNARYAISGYFINKETGGYYGINSFDITPMDFVSKGTKPKQILIGSPEEIAIYTILEYINDNLTFSDSLGGYSRIVENLEHFNNEFYRPSKLSYSKLMDFYRLLYFLKPYVSDDSFLNSEAQKLRVKIDSLERKRDSNFILNIGEEGSIKGLTFSKEIYLRYLIDFQKIKEYHDKLRMILFLGTPSQYQEPLSNLKKRNAVQLILGGGTSIGLGDNLYDVSLNPIDTTVQFEEISRFNYTLSSGVLWNPLLNPNSRAKLSVGLFLNYHLSPSLNQNKIGSAFGVGLGVGVQFKSLALLGNLGFRKVRSPRQFFINDFLDMDRTGVFPLDVNDDSIFFDRTHVTIGISAFMTLSFCENIDDSSSYRFNAF